MTWLDRLLRGRPESDTGTGPVTKLHPRKFEFSIGKGSAVAMLSGVATSDKAHAHGGLVRIDYYDAAGARVPGPYPNVKHTRNRGPHLSVPTGPNSEPFVLYVMLPRAAARVVLTFRAWGSEAFDLSDVNVESFDPASALDSSQSDPTLLRMLHRRAMTKGEVLAATAFARNCFAKSRSPSDQRVLDRVLGLGRELDPRWSPTIPGELRLSGPPRETTVCHLFKVTYPYENSGGAIRGLNLVNSLKGAGYESIVLTPLFYPKGPPIAARRQMFDGSVYYNLAIPGGNHDDAPADVRLQYDALLTASIIAREAPGIIHAASGYRGYELALKALPIGRQLGIPVIYEVRSFHEHLWGPDGTTDSEWTRLRMAQEERCMREAACVVTISQAMRRALVERGIPDERIHVVPNAVGDDLLEPAPAAGLELRTSLGIGDENVIGYVSNLSRREGHDVLIEGVARLHAAGRDVRCLIVGDGTIRGDLEKLARKLGIAERTTFTGEVDHHTVRSYYEAIDIFVVPRRADYAADYVTPLKPFEALALRRPLIMSDRPVAAEIVGNEERGLLFKTGDAEDLAATIARLLDDPDRRHTLVEAGRKWVETERTWRRNAETYRGIYERVLSVSAGR